MDGLKFLDADLPAPVSGQVGAWAKADTVVLFDHFIVSNESRQDWQSRGIRGCPARRTQSVAVQIENRP